MQSPIDQDSPIPLFMQIRMALLSEVLNWPDPGRKFYGDNELAKRFGVSRMTVRQAVSGIVADGLLKRYSGQGTFVTDRVFVERLDDSLDIAGQYAEVGIEQQIKVISCAFRAPTARERDQIDLASGEDILSIVRTRSIASSPLAVDERLIAGRLARAARFRTSNADGSIVGRLRSVTSIEDVTWTIGAGVAGEQWSTLLLLQPSQPVLERRMIYKSGDGRRILSGRTVHRADMVRYGFDLSLDADGPKPREMTRIGPA